MERTTSPRRGVTLLALAILVAGAMAASSAGAAAPVTKKKVKKIATRVANKVFNNGIGPATAPFLRDDVTQHNAASALDSLDLKFLTVSCPAGKVAVGGGASVSGSGLIIFGPQEVALKTSIPIATPADGPANGWLGAAAETTSIPENWRLTVYVLCATP